MNENQSTLDQLKDFSCKADTLHDLLAIGYQHYDSDAKTTIIDAAYFLSLQIADQLQEIITRLERKESAN